MYSRFHFKFRVIELLKFVLESLTKIISTALSQLIIIVSWGKKKHFSKTLQLLQTLKSKIFSQSFVRSTLASANI